MASLTGPGGKTSGISLGITSKGRPSWRSRSARRGEAEARMRRPLTLPSPPRGGGGTSGEPDVRRGEEESQVAGGDGGAAPGSGDNQGVLVRDDSVLLLQRPA